MSKRLQKVVPALKFHKQQQSPPQQPSPGQLAQDDPATKSFKSHKSIQVPIQVQPNQTTASTEPMVGTGWLRSHHLRHASSFHVVQKVDLLEVTLGLEQCNEYTVMDQAGNKVFFVNEESFACCRQCCNENRPFTLVVKDTLGTNVLVMDRGLVCSCCCGMDQLTVATPSGQLMGTVKEELALLRPMLAIKNDAGLKVLRIKGPQCRSSCCGSSVVFQLQNLQGVTVGTISKEWGGLMRELFTDADTFHISFPSDLDPALKAVCMGALFLIDYEYFEGSTTKRHKRIRQIITP